MSEFEIKVIKVGKIEEHSEADRLEIVKVYNYPVCIVKDSFREGDNAVYVKLDAMVPTDRPEFAFLKVEGRTHERIKAKRLRKVFSMGFLIPAKPEWQLGQDVREELGIYKYEPPLDANMGGDNESDPGCTTHYDIEGFRKFPNALLEGEEAVITEKIEGCASTFLHHSEHNRLYVFSHNCCKKEDEKNLWWIIANKYNLKNRLKQIPNIAVYGEVYGQVKNFRYGITEETPRLLLFDMLDIKTRKWLAYDDFLRVAKEIDMPVVPELYRGPWNPELISLSEGNTTLNNAEHIREGIVIKPTTERFSEILYGRCIVKYASETYLLGKKDRKRKKREKL